VREVKAAAAARLQAQLLARLDGLALAGALDVIVAAVLLGKLVPVQVVARRPAVDNVACKEGGRGLSKRWQDGAGMVRGESGARAPWPSLSLARSSSSVSERSLRSSSDAQSFCTKVRAVV